MVKYDFISIVVPAYNEMNNIPVLVSEIDKALASFISHEIILVNDGSTDDTENVVCRLLTSFPQLKYVSFPVNKGQQSAILEGCKIAKGNCVVTIDADLQQLPSVIPGMISKWKAGYDIVYAVRMHETMSLKSVFTHFYYKLLWLLTSVRFEKGISDFTLIDKIIIENYFNYQRKHFLIRTFLPLLPFRSAKVSYQQTKRFSGHTKYNLHKNIKLAILGISTVIQFRNNYTYNLKRKIETSIPNLN